MRVACEAVGFQGGFVRLPASATVPANPAGEELGFGRPDGLPDGTHCGRESSSQTPLLAILKLFFQEPPEMDDGIGPPRTPGLWCSWKAELRQRLFHAKIRCREGIGPTHGPHENVLGGPLADTRNRTERRVCALGKGGGFEIDFSFAQQSRKGNHRTCPLSGNSDPRREPIRTQPGQCGWSWKNLADRTVITKEIITETLHQTLCERARGTDRNLLPENGTHAKLKAIHISRNPHPLHPLCQRSKSRSDQGRTGIQIEKRTHTLKHCRNARQQGRTQLHLECRLLREIPRAEPAGALLTPPAAAACETPTEPRHGGPGMHPATSGRSESPSCRQLQPPTPRTPRGGAWPPEDAESEGTPQE